MLDQGAARVYAAGTHGLFSGEAFETLAGSPFEQIVVTDTIPLRKGAPDNIVSSRWRPCSPIRSRQIFTGGSVSRVFEGENQPF